MQKHAAAWYHTTLLHPGETCIKQTIGQHWLGLCTIVQEVSCQKCDICQRTKQDPAKYGLVTVKTAEAIKQPPWHTLCIDLIGPYKIGDDVTQTKTVKGKCITEVLWEAPILHCMTMINPVTNWFEITQIANAQFKFVPKATYLRSPRRLWLDLCTPKLAFHFSLV